VTQQVLNNLNSFLPEISVFTAMVVCIIADLFLKRKSLIVSLLAIIGLLVSLFFIINQFTENKDIFSRMIVVDPYSNFFKIIFAVSTIFIIIFFEISKEIKKSFHKNEHLFLILAMTGGAYMMASSINMLMIYLSLELASISSYILAGYKKRNKKSTEAAMKYVIYGAASSGIMLYAMSLLYGLTGSFDIFKINDFLLKNPANEPLLIISVIMLLAGIGYKISSVPFQFWTPDVYEGAPVPVSGFLAVTSAVAGMSVLVRFFLSTFVAIKPEGWQVLGNIRWNELLIILAIASMLMGNMVALWQTSLKRLLAYSSIAHTGYMMLGLLVVNKMGMTAILIYISAYLFMNLGAFLVLILIANKLNTDDISKMGGLAFRAPIIGIAMSVFMFSLSGIPSTVGFIGKFYIFSTLVKANMVWLAVIAMLNSVISLFFYVKVLKVMYFTKPNPSDTRIPYSFGNYLILLLLIIPTIFFGLYPAPILRLAELSATIFGIK